MPGRIIEDQPTAKHYGTISLQFLNDGEAIRYAMVNLIYFRSKGDRRIKVYLPQTIVALKRKSEFEKRLGRKIAYPEAMRKIMVKSTDLSLAECTFGMDEAKAVFPHREIESVERITDSNEKVGFVITFKCAHDTVIAHASTRSVKVGDINCRIYMLGSECNGTERQGKEYLTRMEVITQNKEDQIKKKKEYDEKVAKGEIVPTVKKTFPKKTTGSSTIGLRKTRGPLPITTTKSIPMNKTNGPSFKQPMGSVRGARSNTYPQRMNTSPRGPPPLSVSSSSRGRIGRPRRDDDQGGNRSRGGLSPWMENGRRSGGAPPLSSSAFNKDDIRMEQMVREQRRQMDMQERLLRQQEMITVMNDRLHQPVLSSSAFRQRDHELSASQSAFEGRSGYGVPPSINYNKTSGYTPSPAYEPLTATMTPSHLSNPAQDTYLSSAYGSSSYGKPSSSSFPSSSSYRDHRY
ncbi:hrpu-2 [Pristionchus pacificus]|nr:hrpu-2 [Pristionchus pacificus]